MKISAKVEVANRQLPSLNMARKRSEISTLSIGYMTKEKSEIYILHQTSKNYVGTKYKVHNNIINIFSKYLSSGKATIRLKEPAVDLIINGNPQELTHFLQVVKNMPMKDSKKYPRLSNLFASTSKVVNKTVTKLVIKKKPEEIKDFQFPRTLEYLEISDASLRKFDTRILRLQQLKVLNLENNGLERIPEQIDLLPNLEELHLAKNKIGQASFAWLKGPMIRSKIILLDLRENQVVFFPRELNFLKNLRILRLDTNGIKRLPPAIGRLSNLKVLGLSNNKIDWLPGAFRYLKLQSLDVSSNTWQYMPINQAISVGSTTLLSLAASEVVRNSLPYDEKTLPRELIDYLSIAGICYCGYPNFPEFPNIYLPLTSFIGRATYTRRLDDSPVIGFTCCSPNVVKCREYLSRINFVF